MRKLLLGLFFGLLTQAALAQAPGSLPGCQYNATPPTLADKQTTVWQCDVNGKLITSATATPPGGSNGQLQYNNAGAFGGITGATTNGTFVTLTTPVLGAATGTSLAVTGLLQAGTTIGISTDTFLSRLAAATWHLGAADVAAPVAQTLGVQGVVAGTANTAGANLTIAGSVSTGSAAGGSIIFQTAAAGGAGSGQNALATALTLDSTKKAAFAGVIAGTAGSISAPSLSMGNTGTGFYGIGSTAFRFTVGSTDAMELGYFGGGYLALNTTGSITWGVLGTSTTTGLYNEGTGTLALRNSTTAQVLRVYKTFTDASNYERFSIDYTGASWWIKTEQAGTGVSNSIYVGPSGASTALGFISSGNVRWNIDLNGHLLANTDNTYDIGALGATRPRDYFGGGRLYARTAISTGAVPTLALAGGTCAGTVIAGGSTVGTVTLTGICAATNTMTLSVMPTAPTGYVCDAIDRTLGSSLLVQTGTSTTTAVFTFGGTTGATDVLAYKCIGY